MYGTWPEYLEARGHHVVYGAVYSGSPFDLLRRIRQIRRHCRDYQICFIEAHLSLGDGSAHICFSRFGSDIGDGAAAGGSSR